MKTADLLYGTNTLSCYFNNNVLQKHLQLLTLTLTPTVAHVYQSAGHVKVQKLKSLTCNMWLVCPAAGGEEQQQQQKKKDGDSRR